MNQHYCPLLASCIPANRTCSLEELASYLLNPSHAYYGQNCVVGYVWCPGSQSCIMNTSTCSYNSSLAFLSPNITCPGSESFCVGERRCTNASCTDPVKPAFTVYENGTGTHFIVICVYILYSRGTQHCLGVKWFVRRRCLSNLASLYS